MKILFYALFLIISVSSVMMSQNSKKLFHNGKIYTVNEKSPFAEAVVTEGNKIVFVGSYDEAVKLKDGSTEVIDLEGRLMLPGFTDNHVHFVDGGLYLLGIDLRPAKSTAEFKQILRDYVKNNEGKWITGGNWDHEAWEKKELPVMEMIDDFTPNTPVFISRFDGHMGLANSYALKLAGIDKNTVSPDGGVIVKDEVTGEPTGMLKDNAMNLVYAVIPPTSDKEIYEGAVKALEEAKRLGVTAVHDITFKDHLKIYKQLESEGKLTCKIYTRMPISEYKDLVNEGVKVNTGSELIKMGSLKAFADGSLGSSTAWFFEPYVQDTSTSGLPMDIVNDGKLNRWSEDADKNGLQLSIHAIGDRANSYVLDMYEDIIKKNGKWDRRFRIEHAQHVRPEDVKRFSELGVIASAQPYHAIDDGVWAEKRIGKERLEETYPFRSFLESDAVLCFGSDWPVAPLDPILGIYSAVTRRTLDDKNPGGWIPEEKISAEEAVKAYTLSNAYAGYAEKISGSIEPGKAADLVILNENILEIAPEKIKDVKVDVTIFNGEIIYTRK